MRRFWLLLAMLVAGTLAFVGCEGDSGDDDDEATPAVADEADEEAEPAPDPDAAFANITPAGLSMDQFVIVGRGTAYTFTCNAIDGAVSYTFTSSLGTSETVGEPTAGVLDNTGAVDVTFEVYATNGDGINTRTAGCCPF